MNDAKQSDPHFTHVAYFFIRTAMIKGRVFGYWKDGGRFRKDDKELPDDFFAKIDMVPRGGWDGRIRFRKIGEPPPADRPAPQRPAAEQPVTDGDEADENAAD